MTKPESTRGNEDSFWLDGETSVIREEPDAAPTYDLEERTARFGEEVIDFAKTIPQGPTTDRIISQLIGGQQVSARTMSKLMTPFPKENFSSVMAPARRRRVKLSIFCVWPSARFQN
jgi:hypothetical protein